MWFDKIITGLSEPQIINDSKTPSGKIHVGSLRGVLVHDALYRALKENDVEARYMYGIDDYDPLDGLPANANPELVTTMGLPLCNIPAPDGSTATDLADHYITEFLDIFKELGVKADIYRMRDVYKSGQFNEAIDTILSKAAVVREVYKKVSNADRPDDWYPFQVICENCAKIGTTVVTAYNGKEVTYHCKPDLVSWATGCDYKGTVSPFDGNGKLPWKLEWVAKWHTFSITIEGAGKDHSTKGGSRDVAVRCLKAIFGDKPPLNVPYEFFLVSGAKMSSSKGVGTAAREMADFLPPEVLRFLMIRAPAKRTVNFSTDLEYITRLFNEYDRLIEAGLQSKTSADQNSTIAMTEVTDHLIAYHPLNFQLLVSLLQLPHIDIHKEVSKRLAAEFHTPQYQQSLQKRISAAQYWLDNYSTPEQRLELQESLPEAAKTLSATQKAFLNLLGKNFPTELLNGEEYQTFIFDIARLTPINQKQAFEAIYIVLFAKNQGPKAGSLFMYMDKSFLAKQFQELEYSVNEFWKETSISESDYKQWLAKHSDKIKKLAYEYKNKNTISQNTISQNTINKSTTEDETSAQNLIELKVTLNDLKTHMLRVTLSDNAITELENQIKTLN